MTQTIDIEKPREVLRKVAEFRNGLEQGEQMLIDAVVSRGLSANGDSVHVTAPADELPRGDELKELADKVKAFEQTLPDDERELLDSILVKGSADDDEVEAHGYALLWWVKYDWPGLLPYYQAQCTLGGGGWVSELPAGWFTDQYSCWHWVP